MNLDKIMKWLKITFIFVLAIIGIFISSLLLEFPSVRTNFLTYLGIATSDKCQGLLELSVSGSNTCIAKAKMVVDGCSGKNYQISENSCSGKVLCQSNISYDSFQATCVQSVPTGNYRYVLCVDNKQKDSRIVICE